MYADAVQTYLNMEYQKIGSTVSLLICYVNSKKWTPNMAASHQHRFPTAQATGQMKTRTTACHHQKGTCKLHDLPIGQWCCFFSKPTWICDLKMLGGSKQYCWWFRNPANQLRLLVYPIIYRVLSPSQAVQDFFHQQYYPKWWFDGDLSWYKKVGELHL